MKKILTAVILICVFLCGCTKNPKDILKKDTQTQYPAKEEKYNYTNQALGFGLNFPESWNDYYKVEEYDEGISVMFYGKSLAGQGVKVAADNGLIMFFVLNGEEVDSGFYDSITKIGTAKGVDYYYATTTDVSLAPVMMINDEEISRLRDLYGDEIYAENQIPLIREDRKKSQKMQKEIPEVLKTFGEIN